MFEAYRLIGLFAETSLHPGTGSTTDVVDLPIQREKHTQFPIIQSSGLKGAMREKTEQGPEKNFAEVIFGPSDSDHAGSIAITDARLLAFPVRSLTGVYVWVTCPSVISRLNRDLALIRKPEDLLPEPAPAVGDALIAEESNLSGNLVLEEVLFKADPKDAKIVSNCIKIISSFVPSDNAAYTSIKAKMGTHLVVIHDNDFSPLVTTATQVTARNVLNKDTKTSKNLWYEESLPPDTLFYTVVMAAKPRNSNSGLTDGKDVLGKLAGALMDNGGYLQIGGNETVGMGWCAVSVYGG
jgi:CRISPR-associated protein Cmr4